MDNLDAPPWCTDVVQIEQDDVQDDRFPRLSQLFGALLTAASLLFAGTPAHSAECAGANSDPGALGPDATVNAVECEVNAARTSRGLRSLRTDGDLAVAARRMATDMVRRGYFSHVSPGGSDLK